MNARLLIDAMVRQTTVLVAQVATSGGLRAPLAHIANEVFLDLARELESQGISRKVGADMFGMALRAYLRKVQRLEESTTEGGRSLWNAVYQFIRDRGVVTRREVLERFPRDEDTVLRSMLRDLIDSGLVFTSGSGLDAAYRAATEEDLARLDTARRGGVDDLLWAIVFSEGSVGIERLDRLGGLPQAEIRAAMDRLVARGVVVRKESGGRMEYSSPSLVVPVGATTGWEAAVYDHFQAVVRTISQKLSGALKTDANDKVGGSTYTFEVWGGHPLEAEVLGALARFRREYDDLRTRVRAYNDEHGPRGEWQRVVVYGGQSVTEQQKEETKE